MQSAPANGGAVHCPGERRNPIKKLPESQIIPSDLALHIHEFVPDAVGAELEHRIALLKARNWSAALIGRSRSLMAHNLGFSGHEIAGAFVFAHGESVERLEMAARMVRHLVGAALIAEALDCAETPL